MRTASALPRRRSTWSVMVPVSRNGRRVSLGIAHVVVAGVLAMLFMGLLHGDDLADAGQVLWRPVVTIAAIMVLTAAAGRLGVIERLALSILPWAQGSAHRLFGVVFGLGLLTSAVLNNDSAVLLVVPIVVVLVRSVYPGDRKAEGLFPLVVFMAAGVAPLMVSNPMNLIVAEYAGISFNSYAVKMLPVAVAGWVVAFAILYLLARPVLKRLPAEAAPAREVPPWTAAQTSALVLILGILVAYPIASYLGAPVWAVAVTGALIAGVLCAWQGVGSYRDILAVDIAWDVLIFLAGVFVLAIGLRNAGVVDWLRRLYDGGNLALIGGVSAIGSAVINNHPMGLLNLLAIDPAPGSDYHPIFAALVGGDLGPRLFPSGSLAGLLFYATLRRLGVVLPLWRFCAMGAAVTIPALVASLALLAMY